MPGKDEVGLNSLVRKGAVACFCLGWVVFSISKVTSAPASPVETDPPEPPGKLLSIISPDTGRLEAAPPGEPSKAKSLDHGP